MYLRVMTSVVAAFLVAGCFTADVKLNSDGSGTVALKYNPLVTTTVEAERKKLSGPGVTLEDVQVEPIKSKMEVGKATASLRFEDVTKLGAVPHFKKFQIRIQDAGPGQKRLEATITTKRRTPSWPREDTCTIRVQLPGKVVETSAEGQDRTVVWSFPSADYFTKSQLKMTAVYEVAEAAPAKGDSPKAEN